MPLRTPDAARAIAFNEQGEVLVVQRGEFKQFPLAWECPGGVYQPEIDVSGLVGTIKREARQETGVELEVEGRPFYAHEDIVSKDGRQLLYRTVFHLAFAADPTINVPNTGEIRQASWMPLRRLGGFVMRDQSRLALIHCERALVSAGT